MRDKFLQLIESSTEFLIVLIVFFLFIMGSGCSTLKSVKDCGIVVDAYTKEQKNDRWECRTYNWFWD